MPSMRSGKLAGEPEETPELHGLSDRFMFQDFYAERSPDQVAGIFGTRFAQALLGLKEGQWQGPVESGLGWHLVWVELKTSGRVPAFEEIAATVKSAWIDEQRAECQAQDVREHASPLSDRAAGTGSIRRRPGPRCRAPR